VDCQVQVLEQLDPEVQVQVLEQLDLEVLEEDMAPQLIHTRGLTGK
jgi:hypothetical protein